MTRTFTSWTRVLATLTVALVVAALAPMVRANGDKPRAIDALLTAYHAAGVFNGAVLVADAGTAIFKKGYGFADFEWRIPNEPDTKFRLGSITKQVTATLIVQLAGAGKL